jgi:hypothetical protein
MSRSAEHTFNRFTDYIQEIDMQGKANKVVYKSMVLCIRVGFVYARNMKYSWGRVKHGMVLCMYKRSDAVTLPAFPVASLS